ncbi:UNVERIFIED_CONTAM: hypothetical protein HDU68_002519 [Siphonaria sp. JEL0065]|nr:hypothetical protein HDU68_002519 [Siphonaria sp. JEL0065]
MADGATDPYAQYGGYEAYTAAWAQYYAQGGQGQGQGPTAGASVTSSSGNDQSNRGGYASGSYGSSGGAGSSSYGGASSSGNDYAYGRPNASASTAAAARGTNNTPLGVRGGASSSSSAVPEGKSEDTIYITGLPDTVTESSLAQHFGQIGIIKTDKKLRPPGPKIWIYKDKATQVPKGDATLSYEDPPAAQAAITFFSGKPFPGGSGSITVTLADAPAGAIKFAETGGNSGGRGGRGGFGGRGGGRGGYGGGDRGGGGHGGGRGPPGAEGDWECPSCSNKNFARRHECNRCQTPKPAGLGGGDVASGGGLGRGGGGPPQSRDGDWECGSCGNKNFARRHECNKCQAPKPNDGSAGGGRSSHGGSGSDRGGGRGDYGGSGDGGRSDYGSGRGRGDNGGRGDYGSRGDSGSRGGDYSSGYSDRRREDDRRDRRDRPY